MRESEAPVIHCVGAVVHDRRGRLLLVRRANAPGQGMWSLPGGRVEPGEDDHAALRREVAEETGLDVVVGGVVGRITRSGSHGVYHIVDYACHTSEEELLAGDDADAAIWADGATFTTLSDSGALTEDLPELLREWGQLPR